MNEVFLGVVNRNGNIDIPWRGTAIYVPHSYEVGQNLLVTIDTEGSASGKVVKVDLPTLRQVKQMKDELASDWERFSLIFKSMPMGQQVTLLRALDISIRNLNNTQ